MLSFDLSNKNAIVTGGSRGIGKAIALTLARAGANVAIIYSKNTELAESVKSEIGSFGRKAMAIRCDINRENEVEDTVKKIGENFGTIEILVNNAGINKDNILMRLSEDEWDSVLNVNLKGTFLVSKHVLKFMVRNRYGRIVNVSSLAGITGNPGQANYVASKAGVIGLTKVTAIEYASRNINVNAVAPGYIVTDMTEKLPEGIKKAIIERILFKKAGLPEDVANAVLFLVSDFSSYITGQVLIIDGGLSLK